MNELYITVTVGLVALILGIIRLMYIEGYFTIVNIKIISNETYKVFRSDPFLGDFYDGKKTIIVTRITFLNNRVKYKTYSYKH